MQEAERNDERDHRDEERERYRNEAVGKGVPTEVDAVANITGERHENAVQDKDAPIRKGLLGEVPIGDSMKKVH